VNLFPKRGDVWLVNWNPGRGSEQKGMRPALVIQNDIGNERAATTIVAAISSSIKRFPMNVELIPPEGGLEHRSIVKTSQILTVDKQRLEKRLGRIGQESMKEVEKALKLSLDLT
jgi:mRNA interferase MazF